MRSSADLIRLHAPKGGEVDSSSRLASDTQALLRGLPPQHR